MKKVLTVFVLLSLFLVACSQTNVVKLDEKKDTTTTSSDTTTDTTDSEPAAPAEPSGAAVSTTTGKTVESCDDTDLNDPATVGKVVVTYTDGSEESFFDNCVSDSNVLQEYLCDGKNVVSKNTICKGACLAVKVADQTTYPGKKVGFCS